MISLRRSAFVVPLFFFLIGCQPKSVPFETAPAITTVMDSTGFAPSTLSIALGQTVCWANRDTSEGHWPASNIHPTHGIYPAFDPKKPVRAGETWCFRFDKEGVWRFHDHLFPEFSGVVTVKKPVAVNQ